MARIGTYAKRLSEYIIDNYKEGQEPVVLSGEQIKSVLQEDLYNNALVEVRRAVVFQPPKDNKIIIPYRDGKGGIKGMQGYIVVDKDKFDIDLLGYANVRGMSTKLVKTITKKLKEENATDPTFVLKILTAADTLYRRGSTDEFREVPVRLIAICILAETYDIVIDVFANLLQKMGFIELMSEQKKLLTGQESTIWYYKIKIADEWLDEELDEIRAANGARSTTNSYSLHSGIGRLRRNLQETEINASKEIGQKSPKISDNLLTPTSNEIIMFSDSLNKTEDPIKAISELNKSYKDFWANLVEMDNYKNKKMLELSDENTKLKEECTKLKSMYAEMKEKSDAINRETEEKLKSYEGLSIRAKELIREKQELTDKFNKRFGDSKDLEESKKRVLKSLQTILENAGEKTYRAVAEGEAENNYSKLRLKIPAIIEDMGKSIEILFKRKN
jgi:hypothetical protein